MVAKDRLQEAEVHEERAKRNLKVFANTFRGEKSQIINRGVTMLMELANKISPYARYLNVRTLDLCLVYGLEKRGAYKSGNLLGRVAAKGASGAISLVLNQKVPEKIEVAVNQDNPQAFLLTLAVALSDDFPYLDTGLEQRSTFFKEVGTLIKNLSESSQ